MRRSGISKRGAMKRTIDLLLSALGLAVLSPLLAALALAVRASLGSPVLFRQVRTGQHGRLFTLLKFRTMVASTDADGQPLCDTARLTRFGRFLRKTSMDELPQLWN